MPSAIVYHDRTVKSVGSGIRGLIQTRRDKTPQTKKWSFFGQQVIFLKYWHRQNWRDKLAIAAGEFKMIVFVLLFEPYLLVELYRAWKATRHGK